MPVGKEAREFYVKELLRAEVAVRAHLGSASIHLPHFMQQVILFDTQSCSCPYQLNYVSHYHCS